MTQSWGDAGTGPRLARDDTNQHRPVPGLAASALSMVSAPGGADLTLRHRNVQRGAGNEQRPGREPGLDPSGPVANFSS